MRVPCRRAGRWFAIAVAWLALGVINATQVTAAMRAVGMQHRWTALFLAYALVWIAWACATPAVLALTRRFPPSRSTPWRGWAAHAAACAAMVVVDPVWIGFLNWALDPYSDSPSYWSVTFGTGYSRFDVNLVAYAAVMAVGYTVDSMRRLSEREAEAARLSAELANARLEALHRQLEPHFLFNTLHGISGLVRDGQRDAAIDMIAGLSDLLRHVLDRGERQLVPLADELSFVERYIDLQTMRFGERLRMSIDVPLDLYGALVPTLILQPFVENAIVHGIGREVDGGLVRLRVARAGGVLTLSIYNDGPALEPAGGRPGVGLSNARGRLQALYGSACGIALRRGEPSGVETIIELPYRVES
jgi:hypothetical protein